MSAVTDADGWSVEVSEGTPTQAVLGGTDDSATSVDRGAESSASTESTDESTAIESADRPVGADRQRDDQGRFAKGEQVTEDKPVDDTPKPSKRSPEGRKLTLQQEIDAKVRERETIRREIETETQRLAAMRQPQAATPPQARDGDDPGLYSEWAALQPEGQDDWERYNRVLARYEATQIVRAEREADAERNRTQERRTRETALRDRALSVYSDWDDVFAQAADLHVPQSVYDTILTDPDGHRLAYELATNPAIVAEMQQMGPFQLGQALGTLKARLGGASAAPPRQSTATPLPAPIKPLGSSPTQPTVSLDDKPFERWTAEDMRKANQADRRTGRL